MTCCCVASGSHCSSTGASGTRVRVVRDRDTDVQLAAAGWLVVRVWEHEDPENVADRVVALVAARLVRPPRA
jgi:very-short-patch-repair endonuclease